MYADKVLDYIDPDRKYIRCDEGRRAPPGQWPRPLMLPRHRHRLFREHCLCFEGNYIKASDEGPRVRPGPV